jgi:hypothetical protein
MDSIRWVSPVFLQLKEMKDVRSIGILTSLFSLFVSAGALGEQGLSI